MRHAIVTRRDPASLIAAKEFALCFCKRDQQNEVKFPLFIDALVVIKYHVSVAITMASRANVAQFRCSVCGKTFQTQQEVDEHTKRDHVQQKKPAGVS
jgi:hypothetical protein